MTTLALGSEAIAWPSEEWRKRRAPDSADPEEPPTKSPSVRLIVSAGAPVDNRSDRLAETHTRRFIALNDSWSLVLIQ